MLETLGLLVSLGSIGAGLFDIVSGIRRTRKIEELIEKVSRVVKRIEKISEGIVYVPDLDIVSSLSHGQKKELPLEQVYAESLRDLRQEIKSDLLVTRINETPTRLREAMLASPWDTLIDIRPIDATRIQEDPTMSPVTFRHRDTDYIGWQTKGVLASAFDLGIYPERFPFSESDEISNLYKKPQHTPIVNTLYICPGCSTPSSARDGILCKNCNAFVHRTCLIEKHKYHFFRAPIVWWWYRYCPVCGEELEKTWEDAV